MNEERIESLEGKRQIMLETLGRLGVELTRIERARLFCVETIINLDDQIRDLENG